MKIERHMTTAHGQIVFMLFGYDWKVNRWEEILNSIDSRNIASKKR